VSPYLKAAGHDAVHVGEIGLTSTDDSVILVRARDEGRVIVSGDHDFVQMLFASGDVQPSLVLVREVETLTSAELAALLLAALSAELAEARDCGRCGCSHSRSSPGPATASTPEACLKIV
jgi:predicted nuclease of predicted toxin-antitoxin system